MQQREGTDQVSFSLTVDGQPVPVYVGWIQPGLASVSMDLPMLPHTSDTAGISLTVSEPGSSDTFDVTNESVVADQDAWIDLIESRDLAASCSLTPLPGRGRRIGSCGILS